MSSILVCEGGSFDSNGLCSGSLVNAVHVPTFDVSQIDPVVAVEAFSSGLIFSGVPFLVVYVSKIIISQIRAR